MTPATIQGPHIEQVALGVNAEGREGPDDAVVVRYRHAGMFSPLHCCVMNEGDYDVVIDFAHSNDDGDGDAYTALDLRRQGSNVTSITVKPGARVVFDVEAFEVPNAVKPWLRVKCTSTGGKGKGALTIAYFTGELERRPAATVV